MPPIILEVLKDIKDLFAELDQNRAARIIITTHHKPDGDALGSSLALWKFLKNLGFDTRVVSPTDYGVHLQWLPHQEHVVNYEMAHKEAKTLVEQADYIFCLDFNALHRINELGDIIRECKAKKIMIDHHQEPEGFDDFRYWTTQTTSTAQLVEEVIVMWKGKDAIDADIATCLYTGIMTDTGSFRFDTVTPHTHRTVADLIEKGAKNSYIHQKVFDNFSFDRLQFIGYCLANKLEVIPELKTAVMSVTREELVRFNIQTGDTEGLVNYGLSIRGIEFSALFIDRTKLVKISFRGSGNFPCNEFSRDHFKGGGHYNAAGGQSTETLEEAVARFKRTLPEYKKYLADQ
ncbi:MAG: DHH family phosphoesterase [Bacteroidota bacterium]|nr:DHH family phosphoesterase [Bacteroidota bacterium]MDX5431906.1 DHH family phosphoesterase [Bacteroidota bacterium]MDX5470620.1 DHH family phosphoesterase [Bacteroidota bacterium]